MSLTVNNKN